MLQEKLFKTLFFIFISIIALYYTAPELSDKQIDAFVKAYKTTLILTFGSIVIGIILGFILAFLKSLNCKFLNFIIDEYIDIIRGTPILIQLMIFCLIIFASWENGIYAAIIAFGLNSSAYVAEIFRSGINSVDSGQMEAARAMGLGYFGAMRHVVFPQAIKNILPALANEFISLFKETSVVGMVDGIIEITKMAKSLQSTTYSVKPILFVAVLYYICVKIFSFLSKLLEKRLNRHD